MKKAAEKKEWLTTKQAGELIGISRQSVVKAVRAGRLGFQQYDKLILIRREEAERYKVTGHRPKKDATA